ncbi:hypothetical protein ACUOFC_47390, partial [Escherichia sp. TWPC-MK]
MANNGTFHQVEAFRQRIALTTSEDQLTIALHRAQAATQAFKLLFAFNVQLTSFTDYGLRALIYMASLP